MADSSPTIDAMYKRCMEAGAREKRIAVIISVVALCLKFVQIKFDKISIGGSEVVVSDPHAVNGLLGLILIYLCVSILRRALGAEWAEKRFGARGDNFIEWRKDAGYRNYERLEMIVNSMEMLLIVAAIYNCFADTLHILQIVVAGNHLNT